VKTVAAEYAAVIIRAFLAVDAAMFVAIWRSLCLNPADLCIKVVPGQAWKLGWLVAGASRTISVVHPARFILPPVNRLRFGCKACK